MLEKMATQANKIRSQTLTYLKSLSLLTDFWTGFESDHKWTSVAILMDTTNKSANESNSNK